METNSTKKDPVTIPSNASSLNTITMTAQKFLAYKEPAYEMTENEVYMSEKQLTYFKKLLLTWKQDLLEGGDDTIQSLQETTEVPADMNDLATLEENRAFKLRTRKRDYQLIKKIDESLNDIDKKNYGYCEECGVEIGLRRLEARPTATLCIDCKTLAEMQERKR